MRWSFPAGQPPDFQAQSLSRLEQASVDCARAANIPFAYLLENIAYGQSDAIEAHEGLMIVMGIVSTFLTIE
ncbi:hypothetical protein [Desulfuribacillus alkaliarsenatis]|uniref:Uncharacterized protein n=1 Tax=Desulfuribacillus alkaliarsenatis TaxID=766136 RepID=A0A1E5G142_9FIRM|nr:hypothetical protein [Desulfuribacillus alkaliarsenatis]OEF96626.1 hypothetical protein BHF68_08265 [Desulfuribacillus alkaliarsenatis]